MSCVRYASLYSQFTHTNLPHRRGKLRLCIPPTQKASILIHRIVYSSRSVRHRPRPRRARGKLRRCQRRANQHQHGRHRSAQIFFAFISHIHLSFPRFLFRPSSRERPQCLGSQVSTCRRRFRVCLIICTVSFDGEAWKCDRTTIIPSMFTPFSLHLQIMDCHRVV